MRWFERFKGEDANFGDKVAKNTWIGWILVVLKMGLRLSGEDWKDWRRKIGFNGRKAKRAKRMVKNGENLSVRVVDLRVVEAFEV